MAMVKGDNPLDRSVRHRGCRAGRHARRQVPRAHRRLDQGVGALAPGFGALNTTSYTPMLNANLPEKIWFYDIDARANQATFHALDSTFTVKIPLQPFLGCIGVAPAGGEARSSVVPAEFGGNMDAPEARPGYTLYLPVNAPGGCCISATVTRRRATAKSPARPSRCRCACGCRWISSSARNCLAALRERHLADGGRRLSPAGRCAADRVHGTGWLDPRRLRPVGDGRLRAALEGGEDPPRRDGRSELRRDRRRSTSATCR